MLEVTVAYDVAVVKIECGNPAATSWLYELMSILTPLRLSAGIIFLKRAISRRN
jgi:hypothetical protein